MTGSTINSHIKNGVTLGDSPGDYSSPLTITAAGSILGRNGNKNVLNRYFGGTGLEALTGGSVTNGGLIVGGQGGYLDFYYSGRPLTGRYDISGGVGLQASGVLDISNTGTISGGTGGVGAVHYELRYGGQGGSGVFLGDPNGAAAQGNFVNAGLITGGTGTDSYYDGGAGGAGVQLFGTAASTGALTFANAGSISGGSGGYSQEYLGYIHNSLDGDTGGVGIQIAGAGKISNAGTISGGAGGGATGRQMSHLGGNGGIGAYIGQYKGTPVQANLTNSGVITGGAGGRGYHGGTGGAGLYLFGTLRNTGVITGGEAGANVFAGYGGEGVKFFGGVLVNAGTIGARYGYGVAVDFAGNTVGVASTLVVDPGAVFVGYVYANFSAPDVLELAGASKTALTGIGTEFTGFDNISFASGAKWKIAGTTAALAQGETIAGFVAGDAITITDAAATSGKVTVRKNGVLSIKDGEQTLILDIAGAKKGETDFKFANDTLTKTAAKMAFIAPASAAATQPKPDLSPTSPWYGEISPSAPLTAASAGNFGGLSLHNDGPEKWTIPLGTLTTT